MDFVDAFCIYLLIILFHNVCDVDDVIRTWSLEYFLSEYYHRTIMIIVVLSRG